MMANTYEAGDGSSTVAVSIGSGEGSDLTPLLKYEDEAVEIPAHEFVPPRPFYLENNYNFFHQEYTASSLVAHRTDLHPHHHHHHHIHSSPRHSTKDDSTESDESHDRIADRRLQEMVNVIDNFFLPKHFRNNKGKFFRQNISTTPASSEDVKDMGLLIEKRLEERHAKDTGYCPIRRSIFSDCFDEVLRQVIVQDPVTGVLLGRIRDEIRMTLGCCRRLNQSMEAYGSRKSLQMEATTNQLNCLTTNVEKDQATINKELIALRTKHAEIVAELKKTDVKLVHEYEADVKRRQDELDFFKGISLQLNKKLEEVRANAKEFL